MIAMSWFCAIVAGRPSHLTDRRRGQDPRVFHQPLRLKVLTSRNIISRLIKRKSDFMSPLSPGRPAPSSDDIRLGYAPMDDVHVDFLAAVDALVRAPDADVAAALAALERQTREHFEAEERWMSETGFPARDCHAEEHAAVLRTVIGVGERVANGELEPARTLATALLDWFPGHADYMDAALAHWMCKLQLGGKPVVLRRRAQPAAT